MPDTATPASATTTAPLPEGTVQAPINFMLHAQAEKPRVLMSADHAVANERLGKFQTVALPILDGRGLTPPAGLDAEGFALTAFPTAVTDFLDEDQITGVYYPEIIELLKRETGAADVHIFDHTVRIQDDAKRQAAARRLPVLVAHNDYTEKSGPKRVRDVMDADNAERFLGNRFAMINVWRSIGESADRTPLAMADGRTLTAEDYIATDLVYENRVGEIYQNAHSAGQRWYWYPGMTRDEAVLLKCFDTATDGRTRYTAHSAFENPAAPANTPPRESIEVRTMVRFAS